MSSVYVRNQISQFFETELPDEKVIDLTGEFDSIRDLLAREGVTGQDNWIGLQFIGSDETPIAIATGNTQGKYRETGAVFIHIVERTRLNAHNPILTRAEVVRNALRGRRLEDLIVESITPPNFSTGATLNFEGGYTSASIILAYERDLDL